MNLKIVTTSALAAGLLLSATPALADSGTHDRGGNNGWHLGSLLELPLMHVGIGVGSFKDSSEVSATSGTTGTISGTATAVVKQSPKTIEIGTVSSVNGANITLSPAIAFGATTSASANVVTNGSTKWKGASSTASLTSGENVLIVGTTGTSTPGTITASIVIALQNVGHFFSHLFRR